MALHFATTPPSTDRYKALFATTLITKDGAYSTCFEDPRVVAAVADVRVRLGFAAAHPPADAVSTDVLYTIAYVGAGDFRAVFWYERSR